MNDEKTAFRSGKVVLAGRPNVGKSSIINRLLDYKVSIVSEKPQTTRHVIRCVFNSDDCQIVLLDTPGLHLPRHKLGKTLVQAAAESLREGDLVCYVVEIGDRLIGPEDREIISMLSKADAPVLLTVNKCDTPPRRERREEVESLYGGELPLRGSVFISARTGMGLDDLVDSIKPFLPEGPPFYDEEMIVDRPEKFLASEIIREKALMLTHREVPHCIAVEIEEYKSPDEYPEREVLYVRASIYVEREGQKRIVIGGGGERLREIGRLARIDIEEFTGHRTFLDLWVKVRKNWRQSENDLRLFGIEERRPKG
ncbi:MAG: GTPase Era [Synergistaceae bacterium]|nr:GTPase Era [Synergistota bacterium]NLM70793.1 GTPase Era [Synergistaceae bacterium]